MGAESDSDHAALLWRHMPQFYNILVQRKQVLFLASRGRQRYDWLHSPWLHAVSSGICGPFSF